MVYRACHGPERYHKSSISSHLPCSRTSTCRSCSLLPPSVSDGPPDQQSPRSVHKWKFARLCLIPQPPHNRVHVLLTPLDAAHVHDRSLLVARAVGTGCDAYGCQQSLQFSACTTTRPRRRRTAKHQRAGATALCHWSAFARRLHTAFRALPRPILSRLEGAQDESARLHPSARCGRRSVAPLWDRAATHAADPYGLASLKRACLPDNYAGRIVHSMSPAPKSTNSVWLYWLTPGCRHV